MVTGYRRFVLAAVALISVIGGGAFLIADLSSVDHAYESEAADAADEYRDRTQDRIRQTCLSPPAISEVDCTERADDAARANQRVEEDLAAQKVAAWWTKIMGVAAIVGAALSVVGIFLVWTTFREARKTNNIAALEYERARDEAIKAEKAAQEALAHAREVSHDERRPWVSVEVKVGSGLRWANGHGEITFDFSLMNHGQSPALDLIVESEVWVWDGAPDGARERQRQFSAMIRDRAITPLPVTLFPDIISHPPREMNIVQKPAVEARLAGLGKGQSPIGRTLNLFLIGCAQYATAFDVKAVKLVLYSSSTRSIPRGWVIRFQSSPMLTYQATKSLWSLTCSATALWTESNAMRAPTPLSARVTRADCGQVEPPVPVRPELVEGLS